MNPFNVLLIFLGFFAVAGIATESRSEEVDLEIVLAVDASGSVNEQELKLQLTGYAAAFYDPEIQQAILAGPVGKVAVAMMVWADAAFPKKTTGWHVLQDRVSINQFAVALQEFYQHTGRKLGMGGGGTGIGDGIAFSIEMIEQNEYDGLRKVVDVSGDGIETDPWFKKARILPDAHALATLHRIQVNGLAILTDFPKLDEWYRENVIFGPGSFVERAVDFHDFKRAIRKKLWREFRFQISRNQRSRRQAMVQSDGVVP